MTWNSAVSNVLIFSVFVLQMCKKLSNFPILESDVNVCLTKKRRKVIRVQFERQELAEKAKKVVENERFRVPYGKNKMGY